MTLMALYRSRFLFKLCVYELSWDSMPMREHKTLEGGGKQSQSIKRCLGDNPSRSLRLGLLLLLPPVLGYSSPFQLTSSSLISSNEKLIYKCHYPLVPMGLEIPLALLLYYFFLSVGTQESNVTLSEEGRRPGCPFLLDVCMLALRRKQ